MVGITKCFQVSLPETGSQRSVTPNRIIIIRANQKEGSAWPKTEVVSASRSIQVLGLIAATTPNGMASTSAKTRALAPRVMVIFIRPPSSSVTFFLK